MEIVIADDGLWSDRDLRDLAEWYTNDDPETFEAQLTMLRAYASLFTPAQRGRRTKLSLERYTLLRVLHHSEGNRLQMSDISRRLNVSPTSITKLVNALVREGLVRRLSDPSDRRRAWAEITQSGTRVLLENLPVMRDFTRSRWNGLNSQEKRQLVHLLTKLIYSIRAGPRPVDFVEKAPPPGSPPD